MLVNPASIQYISSESNLSKIFASCNKNILDITKGLYHSNLACVESGNQPDCPYHCGLFLISCIFSYGTDDLNHSVLLTMNWVLFVLLCSQTNDSSSESPYIIKLTSARKSSLNFSK